MELKILSWNIQAGGGSRVAGICQYLKQAQAQIIVLCEFRNNSRGIQIRNFLLSIGYRFQLVSAAKQDENSVFIGSFLPFNSRIFHDIDPMFSSNLVEADFGIFRLFGAYFPHKKKHRLFDFLLENMSQWQNGILTGDLNTGKNFVDQKGNSFWYEEEFLYLQERGWIDAFRAKKIEVEEYSWYSHQGNGYRYDHYLVDKALMPIVNDCYYDHTVRDKRLSDHSAMYLILKP